MKTAVTVPSRYFNKSKQVLPLASATSALARLGRLASALAVRLVQHAPPVRDLARHPKHPVGPLNMPIPAAAVQTVASSALLDFVRGRLRSASSTSENNTIERRPIARGVITPSRISFRN